MADKQSPKKKRSKAGGRPFKPGQSGNPLGRPKKGQAFTDILRQVGESSEKRTRAGKIRYNQALAIKVWDKALKGTRWACELIYNRLDGKPVETVDAKLNMTYSIKKAGEPPQE